MTRRAVRSPARWVLLGLGLVLVGGVITAAALERNPSGAAPATAVWTGPGATSARATGPTPGGSSPPASTSPGTLATPRYAFPVGGAHTYAHVHHDYPATDIIAACGLPVRAATNGVILEVSRVDKWDSKTDDGGVRGGLSVSLLGDDGVRYYGSHMRAVRKGIDAGVRVKAGDPLGEVGETGDASVCHLHFGISPVCARTGDWWVRRGVIWPWPYLDSWAKGGQLSPVKEITTWQRKFGCPGAPLVDP